MFLTIDDPFCSLISVFDKNFKKIGYIISVDTDSFIAEQIDLDDFGNVQFNNGKIKTKKIIVCKIESPYGNWALFN